MEPIDKIYYIRAILFKIAGVIIALSISPDTNQGTMIGIIFITSVVASPIAASSFARMNSVRSKPVTSGSITTSAGCTPERVQAVVLHQQAAEERLHDAAASSAAASAASGVMSQNSLLHLGRHADGDHEVAAHRHQHVRRDVVHQPAVDQRLAVADDRDGEHRQVDALEDRVDGVAAVADHRAAAHQVDGDGQARDGELFEPPVVEVLAEHRVEVPAAVLVQEVPVVAARQAAEQPRRPQVGGELVGAVVAVEAGGVDDAGHGPGAGAGDHVHDDAVLLEGLEHAEVGHAAGGPAAEGHADADAAEVVDQPLQAAGQRPAPGQLRAASRRS